MFIVYRIGITNGRDVDRIAAVHSLLLCLAVGLLISIRPGAAAAQEAGEATNARSVTQHGITWTFDRDYRVGKFISGDWWVVGPVNIIGIDPPSLKREDGRVINGSMVNPIVSNASGFDSTKLYQPDLNVAMGIDTDRPLTLEPGASLLSAISREQVESGRCVESVSILTVLGEEPPADAFRPPYVAVDKSVLYRFAQVDTAKLTNLKVVGDPPSWEAINQMVARPFIDFGTGWNRTHITPRLNGTTYGRGLSSTMSNVTLMLLSDYPLDQKKPALIGMIQRGIDLHGVFTEWHMHRSDRNFPWFSDGAHNSGRKFPILFAGAMLGDEQMLQVSGMSQGRFQEDSQTVYITQTHIDATNSEDWNPPYGGRRGKQPYSQAMLGMPEWVGNVQPERANAHWLGHPYRRAGNQNTFHGMSLGVLVMDLRDAWGHDAWFDYQTRYVAIMDGKPDPFAQLLGYEPVEGSVSDEPTAAWTQRWGSSWAYDMWHAHWHDYYQLPTAEELRRRAGEQP